MTHHSDKIAALIGSRICHDLISPVGAISNGIELLAMAGGAAGPEAQLLKDSAGDASARIRLFRIAFGQASDDQTVGRAEFCDLLQAVHGQGRVTLSITVPPDLSRLVAKAVVLAVMCAEQALPYGGTLDISHDGGQWRVRAESDRLNADQDLWALLQSPPDAPDVPPGAVQFVLLPRLLWEADMNYAAQVTDTTVEITF